MIPLNHLTSSLDLINQPDNSKSTPFMFNLTENETVLRDCINEDILNRNYTMASVLVAMIESPVSKKYIINNLLLDYCKIGDIGAVSFIITLGADVTYNGYKAYLLACMYGHLAIVIKFNEMGIKTSKLHDAFKYAVSGGHREIVDELIKQGIDINYNNGEIVRMCCEKGMVSMLQFLIDKGTNIKASTRSLLLAVTNGHTQIVKILLDNGTEPGDWYNYCVNISIRKKYDSILNLLKERFDI